MNKEEVLEVLTDSNDDKKIYLLSHLKDAFESYNKNIENFTSIVQCLVDYCVICPDAVIQSDILEAIITAQTFQDISQINFDIIESNLDKAALKLLPRFLDVLSYTSNPNYINTILTYKEHENDDVHISVENALLELGYKTN